MIFEVAQLYCEIPLTERHLYTTTNHHPVYGSLQTVDKDSIRGGVILVLAVLKMLIIQDFWNKSTALQSDLHVLGLRSYVPCSGVDIYSKPAPEHLLGIGFSTSECSGVYGTPLSCCCLSSAHCVHTGSFTMLKVDCICNVIKRNYGSISISGNFRF